MITSIIPYTKNVKYYDILREDFFSYTTWDDINDSSFDSTLLDKIKNKFNNEENIYFINSKDKESNFGTDEYAINELVNQNIFEKIFETDDSVDLYETYIVYKINL